AGALLQVQAQRAAPLQDHAAGGEASDAQLRPLQVGEDADRPAGPPLGPADALDHLRVLFLVAVAEVEPEDVRAGAEQLFEPLRAGGRRTDRGDDLDPPAAPDCFSHAAALPLMRESRAPQPKLTARQARI